MGDRKYYVVLVCKRCGSKQVRTTKEGLVCNRCGYKEAKKNDE